MEAAVRPNARSAASDSDESLVAKLRLHDEVGLRALHSRYAALVFTVAARIVDATTAEDVVQDVFLTIWRSHETFDPSRGSFKGWITQITRRKALNELRRDRRREPLTDEAFDSVADEGVEPDEAQWAAHRRAVLRRAVDALPAPQRQALSLAFFDELTHEQVASVLDAPLGTAKTRIRSALKRLAPVLVVLLTAIAVAVGWRTMEQEQARQERALRLVTSSDVVPLRLDAAAGIPSASHGTYRAKAGNGLVVLTTSHLPKLDRGDRYLAWVRHGETWSSLGALDVASDGRSLLVSENRALALPADEVRVTRESNAGSVPRGVVVLSARP